MTASRYQRSVTHRPPDLGNTAFHSDTSPPRAIGRGGPPNGSLDAREPGADGAPPLTSQAQPPPPRAPTARAITSNDVINAAVACTAIRILARLVNGIVSVGLNALEFVVDR